MTVVFISLTFEFTLSPVHILCHTGHLCKWMTCLLKFENRFVTLRVMKTKYVQEKGGRARDYFLKGYNCCQSVVMAFADVTGMDEGTLAAVAAGFGGGMGRMREVCGTVSGMTMLAGFISPVPDQSDIEARKKNYALVQHFAGRFREQTGSIICRELLGLAAGAQSGPAPAPRTGEYYRKRPCADMVALAAEIVAECLEERNNL